MVKISDRSRKPLQVTSVLTILLNISLLKFITININTGMVPVFIIYYFLLKYLLYLHLDICDGSVIK